jgi:hypothetical protein
MDTTPERRGRIHRWRAWLLFGVVAAAALYLVVAIVVSAFKARHLTGEYWVAVAGLTIVIGGLLRWALTLRKRITDRK